jgi:tetratricopeptide (TPR) repeat protein
MALGGSPVAAASTETILEQARRAVGDHGLAEIRNVEDSLAQAAQDSVQMAPGFGRLARLWAGHHQGSAAGHFLALEAGLEKSPKKLTFAGRFFLNLVADAAADSPSVRMWNARQAVACFQQAQALAPADSNQIDLATAYIEGTGETMQGVQLLLGIVRKDSGNVPALLILGKLAIQSAQWDKAIGRFEQVLQQEPQNREALYFLAEAYKGKGDRAQARATFERVKKVVNNPEFSRDLDEYLKTF